MTTPPYGTDDNAANPPNPTPYGAPMPPQQEQQSQPSKAMAIVSLVLAFLVCLPVISTIVSIVLAIIVLRRSKDGRDHGKGLAIGALVVNALVIVLGIVLLVAGVFALSSLTTVQDLKKGDCITASGLTGVGEEVDSIEKVSCSSEHDAEVLVTVTLSADDAAAFDNELAIELCSAALPEPPQAAGLELITLTSASNPDDGDHLACLAHNSDGSKLTGRVE